MLSGTEALENYHRLVAKGRLEDEARQMFEQANSAFDESRSIVQALCVRFGAKYTAQNRNDVILAGVERMTAEEQRLLDELERYRVY